MQVGFIHGVMNTDNMTIAGETIDYGPCAFLDAYDPATVFSSIDQQGRYAFGNQPRIAHWNLARLAETLLPLLDDHPEKALALAADTVGQFPASYERAGGRACGRLGLVREQPDDADLIDALLALMHAHAADYTNTFRQLCAVAEGGAAPPATRPGRGRGWHKNPAGKAATHAGAQSRHHSAQPSGGSGPRRGGPPERLRPAGGLPGRAGDAVCVGPAQEAYSAPPAPSERVYRPFAALDRSPGGSH